jgi:hypothetical protein
VGARKRRLNRPWLSSSGSWRCRDQQNGRDTNARPPDLGAATEEISCSPDRPLTNLALSKSDVQHARPGASRRVRTSSPEGFYRDGRAAPKSLLHSNARPRNGENDLNAIELPRIVAVRARMKVQRASEAALPLEFSASPVPSFPMAVAANTRGRRT